MDLIRHVERFVVITLLSMMMLTIVISTVELGVIMYQEIMRPPRFLLDIKEMLEIFGFYLMVIIGLELFETIRVYIEESQIHVEVVMLVAVVAVSRKIIIIDYKDIDPMMNFSMAAMVLALCVGYFLIKKLMMDSRQMAAQKKQSDLPNE